MDKQDVVATLGRLQVMDQDAARVYGDAIGKTLDGDVRRQLQRFQEDHARHVQQIDELVNELGWEAAEPTPQFEALMSGIRQQVGLAEGGDDAVLFAMDLGERATNAEYAEALQLDIDQRVTAVLQRNLADEARHLEYIEARVPGLARARPAVGGGKAR